MSVHRGAFVGRDDRREAARLDIVQDGRLQERDSAVGARAVVPRVRTLPAGDDVPRGLDLDRPRPFLRHDRQPHDVRPREFRTVREPVEPGEDDVAVDEVEVVRADPVPQRIQRPARAQDLRLVARAAPVRRAPRLDLFVQVVAVDRDFLHAPVAQLPHDVRQHAFPPDGQERFGRRAREGTQARPETRGENDGFLDDHGAPSFLSDRPGACAACAPWALPDGARTTRPPGPNSRNAPRGCSSGIRGCA